MHCVSSKQRSERSKNRRFSAPCTSVRSGAEGRERIRNPMLYPIELRAQLWITADDFFHCATFVRLLHWKCLSLRWLFSRFAHATIAHLLKTGGVFSPCSSITTVVSTPGACLSRAEVRRSQGACSAEPLAWCGAGGYLNESASMLNTDRAANGWRGFLAGNRQERLSPNIFCTLLGVILHEGCQPEESACY